MKVLVTGAAGYLGCRLIKQLVNRGDHVTAVDQFYFGLEDLPQHSALTWVKCDVRDVERLPVAGIDAVISLAAASSAAAAAEFPADAADIGVAAREHLALRARDAGVRRFILPSSSNVYGPSENPLAETAPVVSTSVYTSTCLEAERRLLALTSGDFDVVVLRQATLYGWSPKIRFDLVVNNMVRYAMAAQPLPVAGDGYQRRPFLHVDDAVDAHILVLGAPTYAVGGRVFNVAESTASIPVNTVAAIVHERLGNTGVRFYGEIDKLSHCVNSEAIRDAIGWTARRDLAASVDDLAAHLRKKASLALDQRTNRSHWLTEIGGFAQRDER